MDFTFIISKSTTAKRIHTLKWVFEKKQKMRTRKIFIMCIYPREVYRRNLNVKTIHYHSYLFRIAIFNKLQIEIEKKNIRFQPKEEKTK